MFSFEGVEARGGEGVVGAEGAEEERESGWLELSQSHWRKLYSRNFLFAVQALNGLMFSCVNWTGQMNSIVTDF